MRTVTKVSRTPGGQYQAVIDGKVVCVPDDPENSDRILIAEWEALGGAVSLPSEPSEQEVRATMPPLTPRQLRLALVQSGTSLSSVEAALDAIEDPAERELAQIEWNYATRFERTDTLLTAIAAVVGYTDTEIDTLWLWAGTL